VWACATPSNSLMTASHRWTDPQCLGQQSGPSSIMPPEESAPRRFAFHLVSTSEGNDVVTGAGTFPLHSVASGMGLNDPTIPLRSIGIDPRDSMPGFETVNGDTGLGGTCRAPQEHSLFVRWIRKCRILEFRSPCNLYRVVGLMFSFEEISGVGFFRLAFRWDSFGRSCCRSPSPHPYNQEKRYEEGKIRRVPISFIYFAPQRVYRKTSYTVVQ
jgi:hypothetical protein